MNRVNLRNQISKAITTLAIATGLVGCAHVNSVSLTPIPANRSKPVRAEASKTVFLAFNFDNDFVDRIVDDLKSQCPNGVVTGILTKDETIAYVLVFTRNVVATGFCTASVAHNSPRATRSTSSETKAE